ncbi:uncharacterized protein EKO05_0006061 [Ascochyta rabiei]|uniref:Cellular metabolic process n=1 Tax=Didymella rabiei TaxID=5454 RepID=A0A163IF66_DIDRA|nr:uncharacterized protein EKO05_0006061 [Ascochyta rabiei]KZM25731.1 cellular metabolic process [Ascochyta rabiei]UPX15618.1 hypothetical protein EKO05_0006061 [Ascochyta rabiei]
MLELAVAEAYRPHTPKSAPKKRLPKSSSFATNPKIRAPTFSLRSRPASSLSNSSSAYSQPRSFRSITSWRKRTDSVLSSTTETPESSGCVDLVLSSTTQVPDVCTSCRPVPISDNRPRLPLKVPLPPQEELEEFDLALQAAINHLQNSAFSSAHNQASAALAHLAHIADIVSCVATSWPEFWTMLVHAAQLLCSAKQGMSRDVASCLVQALERVARWWNEEQRRTDGDESTAELARITGSAFDQILRQRKDVDELLSGVFETWLEKYIEGMQRVNSHAPAWSATSHTSKPVRSGVKQESVLRILTPTPSPAIFAMLSHALSAMPSVSIAISIMSTPDVTPPSELCPISPSTSRLRTTVFPAQAIGTASRDVDILLLRAEAFDSQGNIQSTRGALSAAACVKTLSSYARVVVLVGLDSIVSKSGKRERDSEPWNVLGLKPDDRDVDMDVKLAWAPARLMDTYIMETGVLELGEMEKLATEAGERVRYIFGE